MEAFRRNLSTVADMEDWDVVYKQVSTWDTDDVVGWIRGTCSQKRDRRPGLLTRHIIAALLVEVIINNRYVLGQVVSLLIAYVRGGTCSQHFLRPSLIHYQYCSVYA